nr:NUDIX hydrolase [Corynebacterium phocae]
MFLSGRFQQIPVDPGAEFDKTTLAAGAVLWRGDRNNPEIAVIHRPHYDDWSLAKGKVDPGESLPATAVREIAEETGYSVRLGKLVGKVTYPVQGRTKVVYYWVAEVIGGEFKKNKEVDEIRWLSPAKARKLLSYKVDADVLSKAEKRLQMTPATRILYVRHARAHQRRNWEGDDNLRPLDKKGRRQAEMLVPLLEAYQPSAIYSAEPVRCQQTAAPLAAELKLPVIVDELLGDAGIAKSPKKARAAFDKLASREGTTVIVSQGAAIPAIISQLNPGFIKTVDGDIKAKKSSVWVLAFNDGELTGADYLASPLPVR